ncbi:hypothetical protein SAMN02745218_02923 [Desulfofundulus australicus DSM 11792]|uniref:Uncharacterized protein n=1 Tax=Desulfofundulus australicus DSM 11792 TaxID=1121425 RepID=A0A1M5DUR2_9FIRM|nr:hypothetical protein [Desulfofundulus australicus]SHF70670.1 hypothetical protein SAMN02745218_02923 [Desulfofundulus australicus DSM 11792]
MSPEKVFNHDEFCYLTLRQRFLALALAILADEDGRGIGHPAWLRGRVFPAEAEHISLSEIERDCEAIQRYLPVKFWTVEDGKKYYGWED